MAERRPDREDRLERKAPEITRTSNKPEVMAAEAATQQPQVAEDAHPTQG